MILFASLKAGKILNSVNRLLNSVILCLYTLERATSSELEIDDSVDADEPGGTRDDEGENMTTQDSRRTCEGVGLTCVRRADEGSVRTST